MNMFAKSPRQLGSAAAVMALLSTAELALPNPASAGLESLFGHKPASSPPGSATPMMCGPHSVLGDLHIGAGFKLSHGIFNDLKLKDSKGRLLALADLFNGKEALIVICANEPCPKNREGRAAFSALAADPNIKAKVAFAAVIEGGDELVQSVPVNLRSQFPFLSDPRKVLPHDLHLTNSYQFALLRRDGTVVCAYSGFGAPAFQDLMTQLKPIVGDVSLAPNRAYQATVGAGCAFFAQ